MLSSHRPGRFHRDGIGRSCGIVTETKIRRAACAVDMKSGELEVPIVGAQAVEIESDCAILENARKSHRSMVGRRAFRPEIRNDAVRRNVSGDAPLYSKQAVRVREFD